jgi:Zn-dependent protease
MLLKRYRRGQVRKSEARDGESADTAVDGDDTALSVGDILETSPQMTAGGFGYAPLRARAAHDAGWRHATRPPSAYDRSVESPEHSHPRTPPSRGRGLRLARVRGVPIYLSPAWLFVIVLLALVYAPVLQERLPGLSGAAASGAAVVFGVLLLLSVLLHELGHALTARLFGVRVEAITLWMLGGYTEMEREPETPPGEFLVAAAGPLVSLGLGGAGIVTALLLPSGTLASEVVWQIAATNVLLAFFNLLPGLPLDGGGIVRSLVWLATGDRHTGTAAAGWSGRVIAVLVVAGGVALSLAEQGTFVGLLFTMLVGAFLWTSASQAILAARFARRLPLLDLQSLMRRALAVPGDLPLAEALRRAEAAGARAVVVTDSAGHATGIVAEHAAQAVPAERRPWVTAMAVARSLAPGMILPLQLRGEALLRALAAYPSSEYLVGAADNVAGVLVASDVAQRLNARGTP